MQEIKVGSAILNQTPLDWEGNLKNIRSAIQQARREGIGLLCLPELALTGYGCEDAFHSPSMVRHALSELKSLIPETRGIAVNIGLPVFFENVLYNASAFLADGKIHGLVCKQALAGDGVHYEQRWFKPWPEGVVRKFPFEDTALPLGDLCFELGPYIVGIEICEDAWSASRPASRLVKQGVDIILNPSASHFAFGKLKIRQRILLESSRAYKVLYLFSNLNGLEAGRIIYDGGAMIAFCGEMIAEGKRFSFSPVNLLSATVDMDLMTLEKTKSLHSAPDLERDSQTPQTFSFSWPEAAEDSSPEPAPDWEASPFLKEEEFTRAVGLGLYDYMQKSKAKGFVISLSGGIDSGACALLIYYMLRQMKLELGKDEYQQRFEFLNDGKTSSFNPDHLLAHLLTCVYQSTAQSGPQTLKAARTLAEKIGATFKHLDVEPLVKEYISMIEKTEKRSLSWEKDDLALQNIQARVRGPSVWLLANLKGALLLTTSNRSEAAVGYTTMDGDTCGGLCPIGGVDKNFLGEWMKWVQTQGPLHLGKIPEVKLITDQKPTAELRPAEQGQSDEADLMPYSLLEKIERAAIGEKQSPREILDSLSSKLGSQYKKEELVHFIKKFFTLWQRNQWKRERLAPSFHLDDKNLDPKTWCRYPILSGDFATEFKELESS